MTADSETADKLQTSNMNTQIVMINSDGEYPNQIEVDEYNEENEEQLEEDVLDSQYERITANVSNKSLKNDNSSSVYYISTPASHSSINNDSHIQTSSRQTKAITQISQATAQSDPDERFLLSCLPVFKRLNTKKNALARMRIQQLLYEIEFEDFTEMSGQ